MLNLITDSQHQDNKWTLYLWGLLHDLQSQVLLLGTNLGAYNT